MRRVARVFLSHLLAFCFKVISFTVYYNTWSKVCGHPIMLGLGLFFMVPMKVQQSHVVVLFRSPYLFRCPETLGRFDTTLHDDRQYQTSKIPDLPTVKTFHLQEQSEPCERPVRHENDFSCYMKPVTSRDLLIQQKLDKLFWAELCRVQCFNNLKSFGGTTKSMI